MTSMIRAFGPEGGCEMAGILVSPLIGALRYTRCAAMITIAQFKTIRSGVIWEVNNLSKQHCRLSFDQFYCQAHFHLDSLVTIQSELL